MPGRNKSAIVVPDTAPFPKRTNREGEEAVSALANYSVEGMDRSAEAIAGYLRRNNQPVSGAREELLERVGSVVSKGPGGLLLYLEELQKIETALQTLGKYPHGAVQDFLKGHGLPAGGTTDELFRRVASAVYGGKPTLAELTGHTDTLAENGPQHVFLFRLREEHRDYLQELRNPGSVKAPLRQLGLADRYNDSHFVWEATEPELSAVLHRADAHGFLLLKWVETRLWWLHENQGIDKRGRRIIIKHPRYERSVNFFRVDLATGEAELRIQKQQASAEKKLKQHFEAYCRQTSTILRLEYFYPVLLEPIIRKLLLSGAVSIRDWQITQPKRMLAGTGSPNLLQKTWMHIGYFCASELNCDWSPPGHSKVRTRLKARTGELEIPNDRSAEQTRFVLDEVRNAGGAPYGIPQLEELARQHREWGGLLPKVDLHLSRLNKREIELEKLAEDEWLPLDDLAKAIHTASEKYPGLFKVLYEVRCPETGKTAHNRKQVAKYESPTAIPPEVPCRHKHGVVMHPSRNNIRQVLVFQPKGGPGGRGLVPLIRPFIETRIPPPLSERFVRGIEILLFAVLFVPLSWVTVLAFAWLAAKFPEFRAGIDRSFWLVQVLLAGAVAAVLDRRYLEMALNIFQGFPKSVGKRLASLRKRVDADDAPQQPPDKDT